MLYSILKSRASSLALLAVLAGAACPGVSLAACAPPAANGATVTCTGTNLPAFIAGGFTGVNATVVAGASITGNQNVGGTAPNFQYDNVQIGPNSTFTNNGTVSTATAQVRDNVAVDLAGTATTLTNNGTLSVNNPTVSTATTVRLYGVITTAPNGAEYDNVQVTNNGTIALTQNSAGIARGIYAGENIGSLNIDNFGTLSVTRNGNATSTQAVAGIDSDDDTEVLSVTNHAGGTITATGGNTYAVGGRAQDYTITNDGTITSTGGRAAILIYGGAGTNGSGLATITNDSTGIINGNISITDTSPFGATLPTTTGATRDSVIENTGRINGSFILGAGSHTIDNSGTTTGSITVNQQVGATAGVLNTGIGAASLTFTNEGTFGGNVAISDRPDSVNSITLTGTGFNPNGTITTTGLGSNALTLSGVANLGKVSNFSFLDLQTSNVAVANGVSLVNNAQINTTIFGPGGTAAAPTTNLGSIQGALTLQGNAAILPTLAAVVRNGDVYQLASAATSAGTITVASTALVAFTPSTANGSLTLRASVRDANTLPGISPAGGATLNGLVSYSGTNAKVQALGATVESLPTAQQVAVAGNALSPIVNGADIQLPINSTLLFHQEIDARLDGFLYAQQPQTGRSADLGVPRPVLAAVPLNEAWIEGVDGGVHQSQVGAVNGYNADFAGVIGGVDRLVQPNFRIGAAVGFINADTNFNVNLTGNRESIQTYQGLIYAEYALPRAYIRGSVGDGGVTYHSTRQIAFAGFNDTATANHTGNILTARGEAGVPIDTRSALVVPYAAFTYNHLSQGGYTETSLNGAGLAVNGVSNDSERAEAGGKVIVPIGALPVFSRFSLGSVAVTAKAAYVHDFGNVAQQVTASFAGGNVFIATGPTPNRDFIDGGVGLRLANGPVLFDISYNALARSTYLQQVGLLKAKVLF